MNKFIYLKYAKEYGLIIGLLTVGVGLLVGGLLVGKRQINGEEVTVITPSPSSGSADIKTEEKLVVDIAGEVVRPGVYRLPAGTRIADALLIAGGLTPKANGDYVKKRLNQASKVTDGMKIYIPDVNEEETEEITAAVMTEENIISINNSETGSLMELWGVGEARAKQIINNRPYEKVEELVTKAGLPQSILDKNIGKIGL